MFAIIVMGFMGWMASDAWFKARDVGRYVIALERRVKELEGRDG
jgi:hypothetical protein